MVMTPYHCSGCQRTFESGPFQLSEKASSQIPSRNGRRLTGTITRLDRDRGVGTLLGEDGKHYVFRRRDVRDGWFHDLTEGATVAFEPAQHLSATRVQLYSRFA
jgi:cold shock CspA family protein